MDVGGPLDSAPFPLESGGAPDGGAPDGEAPEPFPVGGCGGPESALLTLAGGFGGTYAFELVPSP